MGVGRTGVLTQLMEDVSQQVSSYTTIASQMGLTHGTRVESAAVKHWHLGEKGDPAPAGESEVTARETDLITL